MDTALKLLRREARAWPYHTTPEDIWRSVRQKVNHLRKLLATPGAYVSTGRGGTTLHGKDWSCSWPGSFEHWPTAQVAHRLGLPLVDTRTVENPVDCIRLSMCLPGRVPDPEPHHGFSYVDFNTYADQVRAIGGTIHEPESGSGSH